MKGFQGFVLELEHHYTHGDRINYVLEKLSKEEYTILDRGIQKASTAISDILKNGIDHAMNQYNETMRKETR